MTGSVALDVAIGLVFIYLLYSLLASLVAEIFATAITLRARNLKEAVNRMINDESSGELSKFPRLMELINFFPKDFKGSLIERFYNHQEIKYLGRKGNLGPSAIQAANFAKVIMDNVKAQASVSGAGVSEVDKIKSGLQRRALKKTDPNHVPDTDRILGESTAAYILSVLEDCEVTTDKMTEQLLAFKTALENWFDRTMEQTTEWYRQRMQKILFVIGFFIAWGFNVNTFSIVKKLSVDTTARSEMVGLASAYLENNSYDKYAILLPDTAQVNKDSTALKLNENDSVLVARYNARLDSVMILKSELMDDMEAANSILGMGVFLPDSLPIDTLGRAHYPAHVVADAADWAIGSYCTGQKYLQIDTITEWKYIIGLLLNWPRFFGFVVTALALSLGAPFWFNLLHRLMNLRKGSTDSPSK
ncbi:MAG: hypothetical protein R8N23_14000 [Reichenbachiella sp.]|uniref:hypothetical protein n=1 Tax=Reichenbachiella sp. TaxID=2184521 RepID=UPI002966BB56|nr:hypothetical protein [Reichenbachiella sp.]MDW3210984.1 hypothetical protein [Reichenbachiella sp.]